MKRKIETLKGLVAVNLKKEVSYPLVLLYNHKRVLKPRVEVLKEYEAPFVLCEALDWSDEEFCRQTEVTVQTLKGFVPEEEKSDEGDYIEFEEDYPSFEEVHKTL